MTFTCASGDGNPVPVVTWSRDGNILVGGVTTPPGDKFGETRSELVRNLTREDNGAVYSCKVENLANTGSPATTERQINVQCKYRLI